MESSSRLDRLCMTSNTSLVGTETDVHTHEERVQPSGFDVNLQFVDLNPSSRRPAKSCTVYYDSKTASIDDVGGHKEKGNAREMGE